jgi:hypothetical protein
MDRVQLLGSRQVCRVVAKIMPVVERVLFALDIATPLTDPTARQLCAGGMVTLKDFTDACRQDLGVKASRPTIPRSLRLILREKRRRSTVRLGKGLPLRIASLQIRKTRAVKAGAFVLVVEGKR